MTRYDLDPLTLDAMVLGYESDPHTWTTLLRSADAPTRWVEAAQRRSRLDSLAEILLAHPWLAEQYAAVRALARRLPAPDFGVRCWPRKALLGAVLGPATGEPTQVISLRWGRLVTRPTALGEIVHLLAERAVSIQVFAVTQQGAQHLPTASWELEPGESPMILLAVASEISSTDLWRALASAQAVAGVLLLEATEEV